MKTAIKPFSLPGSFLLGSATSTLQVAGGDRIEEDTAERKVRGSGSIYSEVIMNKGVTQEMTDRYLV